MKNPLSWDAELRARFFAGLGRTFGIGNPCPFNDGGKLEWLKEQNGDRVVHDAEILGHRQIEVACDLNGAFHHWVCKSVEAAKNYKPTTYQWTREKLLRAEGRIKIGRKGRRAKN